MINLQTRNIIGFAILLFLTACAISDRQAPTDLNNACSIVQEKPKWYFDMLNVERRWQLPTSVQLAMLWQESKFVANAKTPNKKFLGISIPWMRQSSAYGFAQVLDGTWDWYKDSTGRRFASRTSFADSVEFMGWYSDITTRKHGVAKTDVRNQYFAYHEGHNGFANKSYNQKAWLLNVGNELVRRESMYRNQLRGCRV